MTELKKISIGIDLGTTNSVITAKGEGSPPTILTTLSGKRLIPSIVHFGKLEKTVGENAEDDLVKDPLNTYYSTKRLIGKEWDEINKDFRDTLNYKIKRMKDGDRIYLDCPNQKESLFIHSISAEILLECLDIFYRSYPEKQFKLGQVVITIPAYFNSNQRAATYEAAQIAGFKDIEIINEPTAAAIAYGDIQNKESRTLVFDLGGGTFDMSLVSYDGNSFWDVRASDGDDMLGGDDFDDVISQIIREKCIKMHKDLNFADNSKTLIRKFSKEFKEKLSFKNDYTLDLPIIGYLGDKPISPQINISKKEFESHSKDLIERLENKIKYFLNLPKVKNEKYDDVVLVGGSSRIPLFQKIVKKLTRANLSININPDEAVSVGAAKYAEYVKQGKINISDITPLNVGYELADDKFDVLIPMNSKIPIKYYGTYTTIEDFQDGGSFLIRQGNRPLASKNPLISNFYLDGISIKPKGKVNIKASIKIDLNGILTAEAVDVDNKANNKIIVKNYQTLSESEIIKLKEYALKFLSKDKEEFNKILLRVECRDLIEKAIYYFNNEDFVLKNQLITKLDEIKNELRNETQSIDELKDILLSIKFIYTNKSLKYEKNIQCLEDGETFLEDPFD